MPPPPCRGSPDLERPAARDDLVAQPLEARVGLGVAFGLEAELDPSRATVSPSHGAELDLRARDAEREPAGWADGVLDLLGANVGRHQPAALRSAKRRGGLLGAVISSRARRSRISRRSAESATLPRAVSV